MGNSVYDEPTDLLTGTSLSVDATSGKLTPLPRVSDEVPDYAYVDIDSTVDVINNTIYLEPQRDAEDSPPAAKTSLYSGLESSTRELPPAPVPYDSLAKHDYANTNTTTSGMMNNIICDEPRHDSEIILNDNPSSEVETTV